ncbi:unnamed protein product, partial [Medioppia subpectinata]
MAAFSALRGVQRLDLIRRLIKGDVAATGRRVLSGDAFPMRPSIWGWRKFKDFLHFYVMLGVIPLTILT